MPNWIPTKIESDIAASVLTALEYKEETGVAKTLKGGHWMTRFINDVFPGVAIFNATATHDDYYSPEPYSAKQHCAFWWILTSYTFPELSAYADIIATAEGLIDSCRDKFEARWMDTEVEKVRATLADAVRKIAERRASLVDMPAEQAASADDLLDSILTIKGKRVFALRSLDKPDWRILAVEDALPVAITKEVASGKIRAIELTPI